ncbi:MAG: hypothetical protein ACXAC8_19080 [Candidatus Hodarchaeales archaeon]|jgi:hypothetical protein
MELESAYGIELDSLLDLVRLVSNTSPDRPSTIFKWISDDSDNKKIYYGSFAIFPGYYNYKALPVLFFVILKMITDNQNLPIIRYDLQAKEKQISFLENVKEKDLDNVHTGLVRFIPIVRLKKAPRIFTDLTL